MGKGISGPLNFHFSHVLPQIYTFYNLVTPILHFPQCLLPHYHFSHFYRQNLNFLIKCAYIAHSITTTEDDICQRNKSRLGEGGGGGDYGLGKKVRAQICQYVCAYSINNNYINIRHATRQVLQNGLLNHPSKMWIYGSIYPYATLFDF